MISSIIDTNIILDVLGARGPLRDWSVRALASLADGSRLVVNQIIVSELAPVLDFESLKGLLAAMAIDREQLPFNAAHRAGLAHVAYRKAGGSRDRTLPDFLIGAHAETAGHRLLTRYPARYRSYFPDLDIIAPDTHP
ncbi:MAG: type II toxin-antitoxin system VapC family toxin [Oricola sp.]